MGSSLPSPRTVSQEIMSAEPAPDAKYSLMLMQWGQLVAHDVTHVPMTPGPDLYALPCTSCAPGHPGCAPIPVPPGDPDLPPNHCIPFTRSLPGQAGLGPRQQPNQVTSYIDASMVYGSNQCMSSQLRMRGGPLLKNNPHPSQASSGQRFKPLLPFSYSTHDCRSADRHCFYTGDLRVNEQPGLTALHTVLMREHNRLAAELGTINQHWDGEKIYEEARRILAALVQHITYGEFVPRVLGQEQLALYGLELSPPGSYYQGYDQQCDATIDNEFATAAFR